MSDRHCKPVAGIYIPKSFVNIKNYTPVSKQPLTSGLIVCPFLFVERKFPVLHVSIVLISQLCRIYNKTGVSRLISGMGTVNYKFAIFILQVRTVTGKDPMANALQFL